MNQFQYTRVTTPKAAVTALSQESGTYFLAGGTNLIDLMKREVVVPERLVDINKLPLATIEKTSHRSADWRYGQKFGRCRA